MRKITLYIILATILQACGFQHRKYTTGHYGDFKRNLKESEQPKTHPDLSANLSDTLTFQEYNPNHISFNSFTSIEHQTFLEARAEPIQEVLIDSELKLNTPIDSPNDTITPRFNQSKKNKSELTPPEDIRRLRNKRRMDAFLSILFFIVAIPFMTVVSIQSDAFWGVIGGSLINIWMVIRTHRDFRQMKKQMRSKFCENQDKKWFLRQEKRNDLAVFFTPFYFAMMLWSLMLCIIGIFIGFSLF
jgi:hypothetical protein